MAIPDGLRFQKIWLQKHKYDEDESNYHLYLTNNISGSLAEKHHPSAVAKPAAKTDGGKKQESKVCFYIFFYVDIYFEIKIPLCSI